MDVENIFVVSNLLNQEKENKHRWMEGINWKNVFDEYYIETNLVVKIIEKHGIKCKSNQLINYFPRYQHQEIMCPNCDTLMVSELQSRRIDKKEYKTLPIVSTGSKYLILNIGEHPTKKIDYERREFYRNTTRPNYRVGKINWKTKEGYICYQPYCPSCSHTPTANCRCNMCKKKLLENYIKVLSVFGLTTEDNEVADDYGRKQKTIIVMINTIEYMVHSKKNYHLEYIKKRKIVKARIPKKSEVDIVVADWLMLATNESIEVLEYYCNIFEMPFVPDEKIKTSIQTSLKMFGLSQTARYVYNSVKAAHTRSMEIKFRGSKTARLIYGVMDYFINEEKVRGWENLSPFERGRGEILNETEIVKQFSEQCLVPHNVDYFKSPITIDSFNQQLSTAPLPLSNKKGIKKK